MVEHHHPLVSDGDMAKEKFSHDAIMQPKKIKKGKTRWNQCQQSLQAIDPELLSGAVLDFGCGVGYFVYEGLCRDIDIWGVDVLAGKIQRYRQLVQYSGGADHWKKRCLLGNGNSLPFPTDFFSVVTSWFVFEHIENPGEVLREMVRVTRPGGVIVIRAQDARCDWEGHCKIPWVPFLPKYLADIWIQEFDRSPELREGVYDITQPQIISILQTLGCSIVIRDKPLPRLNPLYSKCSTGEEVKRVAGIVKKDLENGRFIPRQDGLYLYARKGMVGPDE